MHSTENNMGLSRVLHLVFLFRDNMIVKSNEIIQKEVLYKLSCNTKAKNEGVYC